MTRPKRKLAPLLSSKSGIWTLPTASHNEETANNVQALTMFKRSSDLPARVPASSDDVLRTIFVKTIENLRLQRSWWLFAPSRVGSDPCIDASASALIAAYGYNVRRDSAALEKALIAHGRALHMLQSALSTSDETLTSIAILSPWEGLVGLEPDKSNSRFKHWQAIGAILLSRPRTQKMSDITRAMFSRMWECTIRMPCAPGHKPVFEQDQWLNLEPAAPSLDLARLTRANNKLMIRLPRLMSYVHSFETPGLAQQHMNYVEHALILAAELLQVQDNAAETELLHKLKIVDTIDAVDRKVVTHSFSYQSTAQLESALMYWQNYVVLIRLYLRAMAAYSNQTGSGSDFTSSSNLSASSLNPETLLATQSRMIVNMLMSWQYALSCGMLGGCLWYRHGFPIIWGALADSGASVFQNQKIDVIQDWILLRIPEILQGWAVVVTKRDMDQAAQSFIGGPWTCPWLDV